MERLSIGEFSVRSRLSPKALRLYQELGLLEPAAVDPDTGYRSYEVSPARAGAPHRPAAPDRPAPGRDQGGPRPRAGSCGTPHRNLLGGRRDRARRPSRLGQLRRRSTPRNGASHVRGRYAQGARAQLALPVAPRRRRAGDLRLRQGVSRHLQGATAAARRGCCPSSS